MDTSMPAVVDPTRVVIAATSREIRVGEPNGPVVVVIRPPAGVGLSAAADFCRRLAAAAAAAAAEQAETLGVDPDDRWRV